MYNLQSAKEEIAQVAKHATALTEYVMSLSERALAHDGLEARLNDFRSSLLKDLDTKFADLERKIFGSETAHEGASAVSDLGQKIAGLIHVAAPSHGPDDHKSDQHRHDDNHHD